MTSWARGREEIIGMLQRRELTQVVADAELAERMLSTARQHLTSAEALAAADPYLAYAALHDAVRKSLAALLQIQGLRATTTGGHLAVQHAARAQFGASMGRSFARSIASAPRGTKASTRPVAPGSMRTASGTTCRRRRRSWTRRNGRCITSRRSSFDGHPEVDDGLLAPCDRPTAAPGRAPLPRPICHRWPSLVRSQR